MLLDADGERLQAALGDDTRSEALEDVLTVPLGDVHGLLLAFKDEAFSVLTNLDPHSYAKSGDVVIELQGETTKRSRRAKDSHCLLLGNGPVCHQRREKPVRWQGFRAVLFIRPRTRTCVLRRGQRASGCRLANHPLDLDRLEWSAGAR